MNDADVTEVAPREVVSLRSFFSDTLIYGLVGVTDKAIGFLMFPITTWFLQEADFGRMNLFGTTAGFLYLFFTLGIPTSFFRFYTDARTRAGQTAVFSSSVLIVSFYTLLSCLLLLPVARPLNEWLFKTSDLRMMASLLAITYLDGFITLGDSRLQADGRSKTYFWLHLFAILWTRGTTIALLFAGWGLWGWITGELVGRVTVVVAMFALAFRDFRVSAFDRSILRPLCEFGFGLVPGNISHWVMVGSDKYMLNSRLSGHDPAVRLRNVGLYSVGERVASIMQLTNMALSLGWQRFAFRNMEFEDGARLIARGLTAVLLVCGYFALGLIMLGDDLIFYITKPRYHDGIEVILTLTLASFFSGIAQLIPFGLYKANRTWVISSLNTMSAVVNVVLNVLLVPMMGIQGAAIATLVCQAVKTLLLGYFSQRVFPIPYETGRIAAIAGVYVGVYVMGESLWVLGRPAATVAQALLLLVVPVFLMAVGFFRPEEIERLRQLFRAGIARFQRVARSIPDAP